MPADFTKAPEEHEQNMPLDHYVSDETVETVIKSNFKMPKMGWNHFASTCPKSASMFYSPPYTDYAKDVFGYKDMHNLDRASPSSFHSKNGGDEKSPGRN